MYENLIPRFLRYVKTETRSDATSKTVPSTQSQVEFAQTLKEELADLGMSQVSYNEKMVLLQQHCQVIVIKKCQQSALLPIWIRLTLMQ